MSLDWSSNDDSSLLLDKRRPPKKRSVVMEIISVQSSSDEEDDSSFQSSSVEGEIPTLDGSPGSLLIETQNSQVNMSQLTSTSPPLGTQLLVSSKITKQQQQQQQQQKKQQCNTTSDKNKNRKKPCTSTVVGDTLANLDAPTFGLKLSKAPPRNKQKVTEKSKVDNTDGVISGENLQSTMQPPKVKEDPPPAKVSVEPATTTSKNIESKTPPTMSDQTTTTSKKRKSPSPPESKKKKTTNKKIKESVNNNISSTLEDIQMISNTGTEKHGMKTKSKPEEKIEKPINNSSSAVKESDLKVTSTAIMKNDTAKASKKKEKVNNSKKSSSQNLTTAQETSFSNPTNNQNPKQPSRSGKERSSKAYAKDISVNENIVNESKTVSENSNITSSFVDTATKKRIQEKEKTKKSPQKQASKTKESSKTKNVSKKKQNDNNNPKTSSPIKLTTDKENNLSTLNGDQNKKHADTTNPDKKKYTKNANNTTTSTKKSTDSQNKSPEQKQVKQPEKKKKKMNLQDRILHHMFWSFKPFTLKSLAEECKTTETVLEHIMLSLTDKEMVYKKEFTSAKGRTKILYWANHDGKAKEVNMTKPVTQQERDIAHSEMMALRSKEASVKNILAQVLEGPSNDELTANLATSESQLQELRQKLEATKTRINEASKQPPALPKPGLNRFSIPPKSAAQLAKERCPRRTKIRINNMRAEWKKRKDKCNDFIDQLADAMEKKPKQIIDMLDIETDAMCNAIMPPKYNIV